MFFSSDASGFSNFYRLYTNDFVTLELWHSLLFTVPLLAFVCAVILIGCKEINEKAQTKLNNQEVSTNGK